MKTLRLRFWKILLPIVLLVLVMGAMGTAFLSYFLSQLPREGGVRAEYLRAAAPLLQEAGRLEHLLLRPSPPPEAIEASRQAVRDAYAQLAAPPWSEGDASLAAVVERLDARAAAVLEGRAPLPLAVEGESPVARMAEIVAATATVYPGDYEVAVAKLRESAWWFGVLFLVAMVFAIALSFTIAVQLSQKVVRPIEAFVSTIEDIERGDLESGPRYAGKGEFRRLADAFDRMLTHLRHDRLKMNLDVLRTRTRMESLIEHLPSPAIFFDRDLRIELVNRAADEVFDAVPEWEAIPPEVRELVREVRSSGQAHVPNSLSEAVPWWYNGVEHAFLPRVFRLNAASPDDGVALVLIDVSRLRLTAELQGDLLRVVRHELKTPLTSARLALHMLHQNDFGDLSETQAELVETARVEVERQLRTLDSLLELGGLDPTDLNLASEVLGPGEVLAAVCRDYSEEAASLRIDLKQQLTSPDTRLSGDRQRLERALGLLLGYLLKHSTGDSVVELGARQENAGVQFFVAMPVDAFDGEVSAETVVDHVAQARSSGGRSGELEFGLALTVARAHDGEVGAARRDGKVELTLELAAPRENGRSGRREESFI